MRSSPALIAALAVALMLAPTILAQEPTPPPTAPTPTPPPGPTPPPVTNSTNTTPPANDDYWRATPIADGETITQSIDGATRRSWDSGICSWTENVWFRVSVGNATGLRVDLTGSEVASSVAIFRYYPSYETYLGCAYGGNGSGPTLEAGVIRGEYVIEVATSATTGNITITLTKDDSLAPYELVAPYSYLTHEAIVGEETTVYAGIQSLGKPLDVPFSVGFYLNGWSIGEVRVENFTNATWSYVTHSFVPWSSGNMSLEYVVDIYGEVNEMLENNNGHWTVIEVLPPPDVQVEILDLRRVPLRTEAGDLRHPLALHEIDVQVCNLGGGSLDVPVNLTVAAGGEYAGGSGTMSLGTVDFGIGSLSCAQTTVRFSTAQAIGDFTVKAEGHHERDPFTWNDADVAYGYNLVAENGGIVVSFDDLLP